MPTDVRIHLATPKGVAKDHREALPATLKGRLEMILKESPRNTLSGADIAQALIDTGVIPAEGTSTKSPRDAQGLKVRSYIRRWNTARGNDVGHRKGTMYTGTVAEALTIAAGYTGKVNPTPVKEEAPSGA